MLPKEEYLAAFAQVDDCMLTRLLVKIQDVPAIAICELALNRALSAPKPWAEFFSSRTESFLEVLKPRVDERHITMLLEAVAHCRAKEVQDWMELVEEIEGKIILRRVTEELLPQLLGHISLILKCEHRQEDVATAVKGHVSLSNVNLLRVLQTRFQLVSGGVSQLAFWCLRNTLASRKAPPYLARNKLPAEVTELVKQLEPLAQQEFLADVKQNWYPLDVQAELLGALEAVGCKQAGSARLLVEQKLALLPLVTASETQQQVFDCLSEATLTQALLDSLQGSDARSVNWTQLFTSPQLFAVGRAALAQTVQCALNRDMQEALDTIQGLVEAGLPPTALAEVYSGCIGALTHHKDTLFAARLGRVLEEKLSDYMTVADRNLVASLNLAIAIEISELVTQGKSEMAAARCLLYEGLPPDSDGVHELRLFLEARTGLPFARDALEKLGSEKGWRSYLKLFGR